jgi:hypothetical protein|tara:strand:- start:3829 stop:4113 length:285 start_codon:yes stop_codon:yes gene_type:complete
MKAANKNNNQTAKQGMTHKQAKIEGVKAFRAGKQSAPCFNQDFLKAACDSSNDTVRLFESYRNGWTLAHLAEPVGQAAQDENLPSVKELKKLGL